jgi:uncharacterized integral membrane protein
MADTIVDQNQELAAQRAVRLWAMGFLIAAALMVVLGIALALGTPAPALPWTGTAFVMAMGLALVVGASKTSSA